MTVTLRQLRAFVAVARTGSFTLAAESLFITQSALSGLIKEFESALGLRVIDRSTRRTRLSDVGRDLYPLVEKILNDLDRVMEEVEQRQALKTGVARVAAPQLMASTLLPEIVAAYAVARPAIRVKVVDCAVESVMSRVFSGEVDFGIGPEREPNSDIAATTLFRGPFMVVFPTGHPLGELEAISWRDVLRYPLTTLQGQFTERLALDLRAANRGLNFSPTHEVAFMSTALAMVNAGLGITVCISYAASLVQLYRLEMRPLRDPEVFRSFYVFTRQGRSLSPAAEDFKTFLFDFVGARPMLGTA
ncbi:LysR family transcriptional regulator [Yanghanlia caeni]|uniref:LysR family transcriptional regulator n=1 Tax=Yanghanlia caeni TaxID=3064283 RepID=A0ABU1D524_9BURK|nr:LysR family transcriptional regulator [Alcaligenaceae bacterium LG-2]